MCRYLSLEMYSIQYVYVRKKLRETNNRYVYTRTENLCFLISLTPSLISPCRRRSPFDGLQRLPAICSYIIESDVYYIIHARRLVHRCAGYWTVSVNKITRKRFILSVVVVMIKTSGAP